MNFEYLFFSHSLNWSIYTDKSTCNHCTQQLTVILRIVHECASLLSKSQSVCSGPQCTHLQLACTKTISNMSINHCSFYKATVRKITGFHEDSGMVNTVEISHVNNQVNFLISTCQFCISSMPSEVRRELESCFVLLNDNWSQ